MNQLIHSGISGVAKGGAGGCKRTSPNFRSSAFTKNHSRAYIGPNHNAY